MLIVGRPVLTVLKNRPYSVKLKQTIKIDQPSSFRATSPLVITIEISEVSSASSFYILPLHKIFNRNKVKMS